MLLEGVHMPQDTQARTGVWVQVTETAVAKLQVLLSRSVELTEDGQFALLESDELDVLFSGHIPPTPGVVVVPNSFKEQAAAANAATEASVLTVEEFLRQPHLLLLGGVDWNRRLIEALRPGSPTFVGQEFAAQAAQMILELSYSGDSDELVAAARAVLDT